MGKYHFVRECVVVYKKVGAKRVETLKISSSLDVDFIARKLIPDGPQERVVAIGLDAKNRMVGHFLVAVGGVSSCPVEISPLLRAMLLMSASGMILVHNHPSGDSTPSPDDTMLTERICNAGGLVGVHLVDHVIIGNDDYFSFLDAGLLKARS